MSKIKKLILIKNKILIIFLKLIQLKLNNLLT